MDTSIFNTDTDALPKSWVLIKGNFLTNIARHLKIPFRIAVKNPIKKYSNKLSSHKVPVGILVQLEHQPTVQTAQIKAAARKAHEATLPSRQLR